MSHARRRAAAVAATGLVLSAGVIVPGTASAQTWTGNSASTNNWSDATNWTGGVPASGSGTIVTFSSASARTGPVQNVANPFDFNQLNFTAGATSAYTLGGSPIRMQGAVSFNTSSGRITQSSAQNQTINLEVQLPLTNTRYVIEGNGTGLLNFNGGITGAGFVQKQGTHTMVLNGPLSASSGGTVALDISGGTFRLGADNLVSSDIQVFTRAGTTLDLNGNDQTFDLMFFTGGTTLLPAGSTLTIGAGSNGGSVGGLSGAGTFVKAAGSTQIDAAQPNFTGPVSLKSGSTLFVSANGALGTAAGGTNVEAGGQLCLTFGTNYTTPEPLTLNGMNAGTSSLSSAFGGAATFAGPITLNATSDIGCNGAPASLTLTGGISLGSNDVVFGEFGGTINVNTVGINGSGGVVKNIAAERLVLNAASGYTGATTINAGIVDANAALATSSITVNSAGILRGTTTANNAALTLIGDLRPGANGDGVGRITVASAQLNGGSDVFWDIQDASGAAGTGYDQLSVLGELSAPALSAVAIIHARALNTGGVEGALANFNNALPYEWTIIDANSLNANVALTDFSLDSAGFTSANSLGGGTLALALTPNNDLVLRFTPVPEPGAVAAVTVLMTGAMARRRRIAR